MLAYWLPMVWAALIAFAVLAYVSLDGFDLGCGLMFFFEHKPHDRDVIVNTIAPVWDGNETWLVLGGGGLFAVFPLAYAVIMPAFYPLIIAMLLGLIFRGVAFEFRFRAQHGWTRMLWDTAFFGGSLVAGFAQGLVLGGLVQGVRVVNRHYAGGWFDWLTGFSVICGCAVVTGYALLGATWLIWRTQGSLQRRCRRYASTLGGALLAFIVVISLWTPMLNRDYLNSWFAWPEFGFTLPVPILVIVTAWLFWRGLNRRHDLTPFLCALAWFVLSYAGIGISLYPYLVPPSITIRDAAAPPSSQLFLLVGALILIPTILTYTAYSYYVFRGKVTPGVHYH